MSVGLNSIAVASDPLHSLSPRSTPVSSSAELVSARRGGISASSNPAGEEKDTAPDAATQEDAVNISEEARQLQQLQARDTKVRAHEAAHAAVGGQYAGSPSYTFKTGPDGRQYAVGGEVSINASSIPGDPEATIAKMQVVRAAALAPAEPSGADLQIAAKASAAEASAHAALAQRAFAKAQPAAVDAADKSAPASNEVESRSPGVRSRSIDLTA